MFRGTELPVLGDFFWPRTPYDTAQRKLQHFHPDISLYIYNMR